MDEAERQLCEHKQELIRIEYIKTDRDLFFKRIKDLEITTIESDLQIKKNNNHVRQLDNYLHLYNPIELQKQINSTLNMTF